MICPRCRVDLKTEKVDTVAVDRCTTCWGTWLDKGEFAHLLSLSLHALRFSEEETDAVLKGLVHEANAPKSQPDQALACPRCGKVMGKVHHNAARLIALDRCDAHGLWLDAKELKQAQVASQALKMVLSKRTEA